MNILERGDLLIEILALTIRRDMLQEYKLNLGEMYTLLDYSDALKQRPSRARAAAKAWKRAAKEARAHLAQVSDRPPASLEQAHLLSQAADEILKLKAKIEALQKMDWIIGGVSSETASNFIKKTLAEHFGDSRRK